MIEGTPGQPYGGTMSEFNTVEDNMRKRREEATSLLEENQALCTITSFPRLVPTLTCPSRHCRALGYKESKSWPYIWSYSFHTLQTGHLYIQPLADWNSRAAGRNYMPASVAGWWAQSTAVRAFLWALWERLISSVAVSIAGWGGGNSMSATQLWPHKEPPSLLMIIKCSFHSTVTVMPSHVFTTSRWWIW